MRIIAWLTAGITSLSLFGWVLSVAYHGPSRIESNHVLALLLLACGLVGSIAMLRGTGWGRTLTAVFIAGVAAAALLRPDPLYGFYNRTVTLGDWTIAVLCLIAVLVMYKPELVGAKPKTEVELGEKRP